MTTVNCCMHKQQCAQTFYVTRTTQYELFLVRINVIWQFSNGFEVSKMPLFWKDYDYKRRVHSTCSIRNQKLLKEIATKAHIGQKRSENELKKQNHHELQHRDLLLSLTKRQEHHIDICPLSEIKKEGKGNTIINNYILIYSGQEKNA